MATKRMRIVNHTDQLVTMPHGIVEPSGFIPEVPSTDQQIGNLKVDGLGVVPVYAELAYIEGFTELGQTKIDGLEVKVGTVYLVPIDIAKRLSTRPDLLGVRPDGTLVALNPAALNAFGNFEG